MAKPFELGADELRARLDEMVEATFQDLSSEFLLMPAGNHFLHYSDFRAAYQVLKRQTAGFADFGDETVMAALRKNSRVFGVLRAMLGMTLPEWADLVRSEYQLDITPSAARKLDYDSRDSIDFVTQLERRYRERLARPVAFGLAWYTFSRNARHKTDSCSILLPVCGHRYMQTAKTSRLRF